MSESYESEFQVPPHTVVERFTEGTVVKTIVLMDDEFVTFEASVETVREVEALLRHKGPGNE